MTQTQPDSRPAMSAGQAIGGALGQAQSVLAALLVDKVAQAGTDRETYLALQRLGVLGDAAAKDRYVRDLVDWLDLDVRSAVELVDRLIAAGLVAAAQETVTIVDDGAQLRARIAARSAPSPRRSTSRSPRPTSRRPSAPCATSPPGRGR